MPASSHCLFALTGPGCSLYAYGMVAACVWHVTCVKVHVRSSALCYTCAMCVPTKRFLLLLSATVA